MSRGLSWHTAGELQRATSIPHKLQSNTAEVSAVRLQHKRFQTLLQLSFCLIPELGMVLGRGMAPMGSKGSWVLAFAALPQHLHGWAAKGARDVCECTVVLDSAPGTGGRCVTFPRKGDELLPIPQCKIPKY